MTEGRPVWASRCIKKMWPDNDGRAPRVGVPLHKENVAG